MSTADSHPENAPESAIARTEQRFREVFESSPVGVARVELDGTWLEVNDRFCDMLGYTHEELVQIRPRDLIHPEDLPRAAPKDGYCVKCHKKTMPQNDQNHVLRLLHSRILFCSTHRLECRMEGCIAVLSVALKTKNGGSGSRSRRLLINCR